MALLSIEERKRILKDEGLDYTKAGIKTFQKRYMMRKSDVDGIWGPDTDNTARTVDNVRRYTKNFRPEEFRCECGGRYCCGYPDYMKAQELKNIQAIRDHWKRPVIVTCGLRCSRRNAELGGSIQNSKHKYGMAIDFYQKGVTDTLANRKRSIRWIRKLPGHSYTYGNGIAVLTNGRTRTYNVYAPYMGNALHTDTK